MDKSTFQGLGFKCLESLTRYYQHRVSPILLREITSDLADEKKRDKNEAEWKRIIKELAAKTQSSQSSVLPDALTMATNELLAGTVIPMDGYTVPREFGVAVDTPETGRGIFFDEHPMMAILRNWAEGNFSAEDLQKAKAIRDEDAVDLVTLYHEVEKEQKADKEAAVPKFLSLEEMVSYADEVRFFYATPRREVFRVARHFFRDHTGHIGTVMRRWRQKGQPALRYFAPYAMYVHRVEVIHYYSLLCGFVSRSKDGKAHLDIQYLYYLPFCHIFSSEDEDLKLLVPFFLRPDQVFVSKADLQQDLKKLATYLEGLSEEEMTTFRDEYGLYPPDLENSFTTKMWKKFMRRRRPQEGKLSRPSPEREAEIMKEFRSVREAIEKKQAENFKRKQEGIGDGTNPPING